MHTNAPIMASGLSTGHSLMRLRQQEESETFCKQGTGSSHNTIFGTVDMDGTLKFVNYKVGGLKTAIVLLKSNVFIIFFCENTFLCI